MGKLDRAWQLFNESFTVLNEDIEILVFPVMSGISAVMVGVGLFFPLYRGGVFQAIHLGKAFRKETSSERGLFAEAFQERQVRARAPDRVCAPTYSIARRGRG